MAERGKKIPGKIDNYFSKKHAVSSWDDLYQCELECLDSLEALAEKEVLDSKKLLLEISKASDELANAQIDFFSHILPSLQSKEEFEMCMRQVFRGSERLRTFVEKRFGFRSPSKPPLDIIIDILWGEHISKKNMYECLYSDLSSSATFSETISSVWGTLDESHLALNDATSINIQWLRRNMTAQSRKRRKERN